MKNITKKEWGIAGTSIGSILIIVALLTMVGIGSNDTYAAQMCTCPTGYTRSGNTCTKTDTVICVYGTKLEDATYSQACSTLSGDYTCTGAGACVDKDDNYIAGCGRNSCTRTIEETCTCTSGTANASGLCINSVGNCPAGSYCPAGSSSPTTCPAGSYCPAGSSSPTTCPAGSYCPAGSSSPTTCPAGSYCPAGSSSPTKCPDNSKSCQEGTTIFVCNDGYYKSGDVCVKKNTSDDDGTTIKCDPGTYYTGEGTCKICPANSYCPGGSYLTSDKNRYGGVKCPDDRPYSAEGSSSVNDCSGLGETDNPSTPSSGNPSSGGNSSTPSGGNSSGSTNGNGNVSENPNTATKTPLIIAIIGTISMALGIFVYFKGKKEINIEI